MSDEQFHRMWTAGHQQFSTDVDKGLAKLRRIIDAAYGDEADDGAESANPPIEAMLAGLAASVVTGVLFAGTVLAGTPGYLLA
jgi:hypothetical protein